MLWGLILLIPARKIAKTLQDQAANYRPFSENEKQIEVVMSILSNYVPESRVKAWVSCPISELGEGGTYWPKKLCKL